MRNKETLCYTQTHMTVSSRPSFSAGVATDVSLLLHVTPQSLEQNEEVGKQDHI